MRGAAVMLTIVIRKVALPVPRAFVAVMATRVFEVERVEPVMMPVAGSSVSPAGSGVAEKDVGTLLAVIA